MSDVTPMINSLRIYWMDLLFSFSPEKDLFIGEYAGNIVRGGFGYHLRKVACIASDKNCDDCILSARCSYPFLFESFHLPKHQLYLSLSDIPRPFVFFQLPEASIIKKGEIFSFGIRLFGGAAEQFPYVIYAMKSLSESGIGKFRIPCECKEINLVTPKGVNVKLKDSTQKDVPIVNVRDVIPTKSYIQNGNNVTIDIITPLRIKKAGRFCLIPEFRPFVSHLLRRTAQISYFYHGKELEWNFREILDGLDSVKIINNETKWFELDRYSTRQQNRMKLGGLLGKVEYDMVPNEIIPLLYLGKYIHVGKASTFGFGKYEVKIGGDE